MQGDGVYTGAVLARPDEKGRLALPAALRNSVPGDVKGRQIYISMHEDGPCLIGSGADRRARLDGYIDRLEEVAIRRGREFNPSAVRRRLFGGETVPLDGSGRFIMPDNLAVLGAYDGDIFFLGMGDYFEIWDLGALMALEGEDYAPAQTQARAAIAAREKADQKKAARQ
jgi:MraZ protein